MRLVVADMDGTLLDSGGRIPEGLWPLLDRMRERGVVFVPASGRQHARLARMFERAIDGMPIIADNGSYVVLDDGAGGPVQPESPRAVAFKADVGALWHSPTGGVAQLTGVWTRPDLRGRGVGAAALAGVVDAVRRDHVGADGVVSLYVNDYNTPAMALYRSLGFEQVGLFATVLL